MSCFYPRIAYQCGFNENGKKDVRFARLRDDWSIKDYRSRYGDSIFLMPCGKCIGCQLDHARDWATRCVLESKYHDKSCFLTLTYDDAHLPSSLEEHKSNKDDFIDTLRNAGHKFRVFGCSERGSKTKRLHFHIILFGYCPEDLDFYSVGSNGDYLYNSKYLSKIWSRGFVVVGFLTFQSAGYVARYTTKKVGEKDSFIFMSNRPGIGFQYLKDNAEKIVKTDAVYGDFGDSSTAPVPRYFNRFLSEWFPFEYARLQARRIKNITLHDNNALINLRTGYLEKLKSEQERDVLAKFDLLKRDNV